MQVALWNSSLVMASGLFVQEYAGRTPGMVEALLGVAMVVVVEELA